jgi:Na+/H+ antiporter NhaD/arsenite permease-like protein
LDTTVLIIFGIVYLGMVMGRLPGLSVDRTGVALLGVIALLVLEKLTPDDAWSSVDVPTIALLFGLMVVSAQLRLGGFYSAVTSRIAAAHGSPPTLLAVLIMVVGVLSAVLSNDVVCLAVARVLVEGCVRRGLGPVPFLLALSCASNVGSAATLIGNPQNMLIGQTLQMSFAGYLIFEALVPTALGLVATWAIICLCARRRWEKEGAEVIVDAPTFDAWQTGKGIAVITGVVALFLFSPWPREVVALGASGILLLGRRMHSRTMLGSVDWQLLVLFVGLFVVNHALERSGTLAYLTTALAQGGIDLSRPGWLFLVTPVLSNLVSNVPAVMLLLPSATDPLAGPTLALASTLAGNLFSGGSIANIIVVTQAEALGVKITWATHARVGVPVTVVTLALAGGWLALRSALT